MEELPPPLDPEAELEEKELKSNTGSYNPSNGRERWSMRSMTHERVLTQDTNRKARKKKEER